MSFEFTWFDVDGTIQRGNAESTTGDTDKPVVLLLHGNSGAQSDMASPGASPGSNYDYRAPFPPPQDVGWHPYPGIGIWSFELDGTKDVVGWQSVLTERGYATVTYSQVEPRGLLARPVRELDGLVREVVARSPSTRIAFLAHSRGGLLVRRYLKDHRDDPLLVGRVTDVVTLHSPHQGSHLGNLALELNALAITCREQFGPVIDGILGPLVAEVNAASYEELSVGSAFLADLATGELPFPGARYRTFGGTSPLYTRVLWWLFAADSLVPHFAWPPFHWTIAKGEVPYGSPLLDALPDLAPELADGMGDGLVADLSARLPFAAHTTLPLNHAEALWDPGLQQRVLAVLAPPDPVEPPAELPECAALRGRKAEAEAELGALQADLQDAAPGQKPAIVAAIRRWRRVLEQAEQRAVALGCPTT
jgi:hypothetical protein